MNKKFYVTPEMEELEMKLQGMISVSDVNGEGDPGGFDPDAPAPEDDY